MLAIDVLELLAAFLLAIEQVQDGNPDNVLLQVRVDAGNGHADAPVTLRHRAAELNGGQDHERKHGQNDAGQRPAQLPHGEDHETECQHVSENRHQARREQLVEHVDVGGDASDQAAHRVVVVERDVQLLQMGHHFPPQIEHRFLADVLHDVHLGELEQEDAEKGGQIEQGHLGETCQRIGGQ